MSFDTSSLVDTCSRILGPTGFPYSEELVVTYFEDLVRTLVVDGVGDAEDPYDRVLATLMDPTQLADLEGYIEDRLGPSTDISEAVVDAIYDELLSARFVEYTTGCVVEGEEDVLARTVAVRDLRENIKNWRWRLENLYKIVNKAGKVVLFKPNKAQRFILDNFHNLNWILKSRRHGITTLGSLVLLDQTVMLDNVHSAVIAHGLREVRQIFKTRVEFPFRHMPEQIRARRETLTKNVNELAFSNGSSIHVSVSTRSGTLQYVLVTELAILYWYSPSKAEEVVSGTLETLHTDQIGIVESTPYGLTGYYDRTMRIKKDSDLAVSEKKLHSPLQYRFFFLPWYLDEANSAEAIDLRVDEVEYFDQLQTEDAISLTEQQKAWYVRKVRSLGKVLMRREHPSTVEEAFRTSVEGAFFTEEMTQVYTERRVKPNLYNPDLPVRISWDLGMGDLMVLLFFQVDGETRNALHVYANNGKNLEHYIRYIEKSKYGFRNSTILIFPHDITVREQTLTSGETRLVAVGRLKITTQAGITCQVRDLFIKRVPRTQSKIIDIDTLRAALPKWQFASDDIATDEGSTGVGMLLKAISSYGREFDKDTQTYKNTPRVDVHGHYMDALFTGENSVVGKSVNIDDLPI